MSSVRYSRSFRQVKKPENRLTSIESHTFLYDVHDLRAMSGKFDYLVEMGGVQGLAAALRTDLKEGLYKDEATATTEGGIAYQRRTELYGTNVYEKPPMASFFELCLEALGDPMLIVLMIAGTVSVGLGLWESLDHGWYEGISIVIAVVLVTLVGAGNNYHQQQEFAKMDRDKEYDMVTVVRGGKVERIHPTDVLVGDIIQLAAGAFIPADGVLVADDAIKVNESRMTGESRDVDKNFYDPFLQAGTEVRQGQAVMIATAVGSQSAYGRIMASLAVEAEDTPLQEKLDLAAKYIGYFGAVVGLVLFITLFIRWLVEDISKEKMEHITDELKEVNGVWQNVTKTITESGWHSPTKENWNKLISYLIISVTIIVVAVPEGLPLAVTVSLAYSMGRMRKDNIMVHKLAACETMGNVTTICSDKTGTLTQNLMTVVRSFLGGVFYDNRPTKEQLTESMHDLFIEAIAINSKAWVEEKDIDRTKAPESWPWKEGNQTEISLLSWISSYGIDVAKERQNRPVERAYPFDSIKKQSSVVLKASLGEESPLSYNGEYRQYFKGAAETIVEACIRTVDSNGIEIPLEGLVKKGVLESIDKMTRSGLRTVAFSYVDHQEIEKDDEGNLKDPVERNDCVLVGIAGIKDPLRPETYGAVRKCQKAGIIVRMVTGDHLETAKFIARECGILTSPDHVAMLGEDFRKLVQAGQDAELERLLPRLRVLARSKPEDKEALVRWYKAHEHVVAVTGDGTNDAPALKAADVGLAMYLAGTAVAKAAAQIWILDDNFASIVKSVVWGRAVYDNIRKFVQFQLTINVVALLLSLIGAFTGYEKPLGAVQLLWVNLIMDTFAALALGTEVPTEALLDRRPYKSDAFLVSPVMMRNIIGMSIYQLGVLFFLLYGADTVFEIPDGNKSVQHFTLVFNAFVWMQFANEINSRKCNGEFNVFENLFTNPWFALIMIGSMGFQAIMVELVGSFAQTEGLTWQKWIGTLVIGLSPLVSGAIIRLVPMDPYRGQIDFDPSTFEGAHLDDHRYSMGRVSAAHERAALITGKEHDEVKAQFTNIEKADEKDIEAHKITNEPNTSILLDTRSS